MADPSKRLALNAAGAFFVDSTCIDCDACRQLAPETFGEARDSSYVAAQPSTEAQTRRALHALLSCPTGSIGTIGANGAKQTMRDFPLLLEAEVSYAGFNSADSYGGNSYVVQHPAGNWLIDSPRYVKHLVRRFEELGGLRYLFLTHRDDVADSDRYATRFGSQRIIHRHELAAQPDAEIVLDGADPVHLAADFTIIPTPGHTRGHCVLLYRNRFLFTGDHLSWDRDAQRLHASRRVCWHSWPEQKRSMARLLDYSFAWVLPGHGQRVNLPEEQMRKELAALVGRMEGGGGVR
ncbi:MAG: MBL fold metallo-hydrolase [Candidatus Tectomicrobia bacterium]|nr:MBL fold metallo-hydrolase [Candidatus Tectomicrobia bacterium]